MGKKITHVVGAISAYNPKYLWKFLRSRKIPVWKKSLLILALAWVVSPLDGDWLPILGWLDDVGLLALASWFTRNWIQEMLEEENSTQESPSPTPISTKEKNPTF